MYFEIYYNIVCFNVNFKFDWCNLFVYLFWYILIYLDEGEEIIVFIALSLNKLGYICIEINIVWKI